MSPSFWSMIKGKLAPWTAGMVSVPIIVTILSVMANPVMLAFELYSYSSTLKSKHDVIVHAARNRLKIILQLSISYLLI